MSLSSSLNAGVQGLAVNSTRLSAISDNIVNANTNGYKRVLTEFSSIAIDGDVESRYTAGGVRAFVKRDITAVGTLEATNSGTDIAVSGNGFFAISPTTSPNNFDPNTNRTYLASTGSFSADSEGYLVNANGDYLLGWELNPDGTTVVPSPSRNTFANLTTVNSQIIRYNSLQTSNIRLSGPLPSGATDYGSVVANNTVTHTEEYFDTIGNIENLNYIFTPIPSSTIGGTSNTWQLDIEDSATTINDGLIGRFTVVFNDASDANPGSIASVTAVPIETNLASQTVGDGTVTAIDASVAGTNSATLDFNTGNIAGMDADDVYDLVLDFNDGTNSSALNMSITGASLTRAQLADTVSSMLNAVKDGDATSTSTTFFGTDTDITSSGSAGVFFHNGATVTLTYNDNTGGAGTINEATFVAGLNGSGTPAESLDITNATAGEVVLANNSLTTGTNQNFSVSGNFTVGSTVTASTYDPATGIINSETNTGTIDTFVGIPETVNGISQTGALTEASIRLDYKDGSGYGELQGVEIDDNGIVQAFFSNDQSRPIYQVPIVNVANPNALDPVGGQAYQITTDAGSISLTNSGERLSGKIINYALTKSTVDVAQELTQMIETQRAYSSNAKIIQTVDEMLQETTNIKR